MMTELFRTDVIAVFDIGASLKRFQLFDWSLNAVETEEKIIGDAWGDPEGCPEDIPAVAAWMEECLSRAAASTLYGIRAVNIASGNDCLPGLGDVLAAVTARLPDGERMVTGPGISNALASLVPYLKGAGEPIIMLSTGVRCTFIRSSDPERHFRELAFSDTGHPPEITGKETVSLPFPLGEIHDRNVEMLDERFGVTGELYKTIRIRQKKIVRMEAGGGGRVFFRNGIPEGLADRQADLTGFLTYADAYHRMMYDLVDEYLGTFREFISNDQLAEIVYVTGGFALNESFVRILASRLPGKRVYASTITNATALGAAMVLYRRLYENEMPPPFLGLKAVLLLDE